MIREPHPFWLLAASVSFTTSAAACSIFSLSTGDESVFGQNLDWSAPVPGQVVINPRGIEKTILPWRGHWPASGDFPTISWTSRYGSVTFTCYGRDFIEGGMNEAGLMVYETSLTAVYPPEDDRPGVSCPQWMQYQLDNYATVEEVLAHLEDLRPDGEGWHYLIADRSGQCAVIEYLSGEALVHTGDAAEVRALTNTTYEQALSHIPLDQAFGGGIDIAAGNDAYGRFLRMAILLRDYDPPSDGEAADHAFRVLQAVSVEDTRRSVVYDASGGRILWTSKENARRRWLDLAALDFREAAPVQVVDVDAGGSGDVSAFLTDYTIDGNRSVVWAILGASDPNSGPPEELTSRGLTREAALDMIARHPTNPTP